MTRTRSKKSYTVPKANLYGETYRRIDREIRRLNSPKTKQQKARLSYLKSELSRREFTIPTTPPRIKLNNIRATRNKFPTCLDFSGSEASFKILYPEYKFCSECRAWEEDQILNRNASSKTRRTSPSFKCSAKHTCWIHPTDSNIYHHTLFKREFQKNRNSMKITVRKKTNLQKDHTGDETLTLENGSPIQNSAPIESETEDCHFITNESFEGQRNYEREQNIPALLEEIQLLQSQQEQHLAHINDLQKENDQLHNKISNLTTQINSLHQNNWRARKKRKILEQNSRTFAPSNNSKDSSPKKYNEQKLSQLLSEMRKIGYRKHPFQRQQRMVREICDTFFQPTFLNGSVEKECDKRTRAYLKKSVFSPGKILHAMDMAGGGLCYKGIEILCSCETQGTKYYRNSILPCAADMKRAARKVEKFAIQKHLVFDHGRLSHNGAEFIRFEPKHVLRHTLEAFGVYHASKSRRVAIGTAIDAAQITKKQNHTTFGIKMQDKEAVCPNTKQPLFANNLRDKSFVQSRNVCIPLQVVLAPETKDIYKVFENDFTLLTKDEHSTKEEYSAVLGEGHKPLLISTNCDLSAQWKGLGRGGAAKVAKYPCTCCSIHDTELVTPNVIKCNKWCREWAERFPEESQRMPCYHRDMLTNSRILNMEESLAELEGILNNLTNDMDKIEQESIISTKENPYEAANNAVSSLDDPLSIHYCIDPNLRERTFLELRQYNSNIVRDLILRGLSVAGSLKERKDRLSSSLRQEFTFRELQRNIKHGKAGTECALFVLMNTIPCILHMENRVGLKIVTRLLEIGLSNAKAGKLIEDCDNMQKRPNEKERVDDFLSEVNNTCNRKIWGTERCPTQWECRYDRGKKQIDTICLDNNRTRALITGIDLLIDCCFPDNENEIAWEWKKTIGCYRKAMSILRCQEDLSDEEIIDFQWNVDCFFSDWITLSEGRPGMTNYIHLLAAGHISEYLFKWRNLYVHSQQGWEALNSMIKTYFLRRTGRGGSAGVRGDDRSKLKPLGRWFQRRLVWMSGVSMADIERELETTSENIQEEDNNNECDIHDGNDEMETLVV